MKFKNIYIFITLLIIINGCKVNKTKKQTYLYYKAYNFIINEKKYKKEDLNVVDTLFYVSQIIKFEKIKSPNDLKFNESLIDSLNNIDEKNWFKEFYSPEIENLKLQNENSTFNLYFSKLFKNEINLEIVNNRGNYKNSHKFLTRFSNSIVYTFNFNKNGDIIFVDKTELTND